MKKTFLTLLLFGGFSVAASYAQSGSIAGTVTDIKGKPLPKVAVQVTEGGIAKGSAATDADGHYLIKPLGTGTYDLQVSQENFQTALIEGIPVTGDQETPVNATMDRVRPATK